MSELSALKSPSMRPWLFGPGPDLMMFVLPIFVAAFFLFLIHGTPMAQSQLFIALALSGFGVGPFHFGATWFHYFDKANYQHYSSPANVGWSIVFPALLFAATVGGYWLAPNVVLFVYFIWTIQHIMQQNVGILLLYHNHGRNEAVVDRNLEVKTVQTATAFFNFLFLCRVSGQAALPAMLTQAVTIFIGAECLWLVFKYVAQLQSQLRSGKSLNLPAFGFWVLSLLFFLPVGLFAKAYNDGLIFSLFIHWAQYIGLNTILVGRKYSHKPHQLLAFDGKPYLLFILIGLLCIILMMTGPVMAAVQGWNDSWQLRLAMGVYMGLTLVHYVQDSYIWRFREQFNRDALLVHLKPEAASKPAPSQAQAKVPASV